MAEIKAKKPESTTVRAAAVAVAPVAVAPAAPVAAERPTPKIVLADKAGWWWGLGRRKHAVARVRLRPAKGDGKVQIHTDKSKVKKLKSIDEYFAEDRDRTDAMSPLKVTNVGSKVEVFIRVNGGGYMGQAQAIKLAIARALKNYDPSVEPSLRAASMLTRDSRDVERKKYGQAGARRKFQFSKR